MAATASTRTAEPEARDTDTQPGTATVRGRRRRVDKGAAMALTIKNEEAHRLVRELTELTGETQATAVTVAVRERLRRIRGTGETTSLSERLLAIAEDAAPRFKEPFCSTDHGDLLYDEDGLPR